MKKCQGCHQEIDKYAIACEYCGKLAKGKEEPGTDGRQKAHDTGKSPVRNRKKNGDGR